MQQTPGRICRNLWKWISGALLILTALTGMSWYVLFEVNEFALSISLNGNETIIMEYGEDYDEPGAEVLFRGTLFHKEGFLPDNAKLEIVSNVDESHTGRYTVRYVADFLWWHAESSREVEIRDSRLPVITLEEDPEESLLPGTIYQETGYSAWDNYDGDITDRVIRTESMGLITYTVTDSYGNTATAVREVPHHDPVSPEIRLEGGTEYAIKTGTVYREPGYAASDNVDGDLTDSVIVEGSVDWLTPGTYPITYTVTDTYENVTVATRNVQVTAAALPDTVYPEGKTIYLTFDDGPGPYTTWLLDILDQYNVKATFFVKDTGEYALMKEIVERGHSIGIHTVTHDYAQIYASPEAFFADLYQMQAIIYEHTGVLTNLMRFPGGSSNLVSRRYCEGIMTILTEAVQNAGFCYFDWNVSSGDAGDTTKTREVYDYVINGVKEQAVALVLQHDIHGYSVAAVEDIIVWGIANGYQFLPLRDNSPGFHQELNN